MIDQLLIYSTSLGHLAEKEDLDRKMVGRSFLRQEYFSCGCEVEKGHFLGNFVGFKTCFLITSLPRLQG